MEQDQREEDLDGRTTPTMKNNLRRGVEFFNSKRYEQAILEWSKVLREDPLNKKALDFIQKSRARISKAATPEDNAKVAADAAQCYSIGLQYFQEEEYQMAINQWIRALTYQPDHAEALSHIKDAQGRIQSGAAPTKARPGEPPPAAKVLKDVESGGFARAEVAAAEVEKPKPAKPAPKPAGKKVSEEDNQRLAAEAEALYEEILGSDSGASPKAKGGGGLKMVGGLAKAEARAVPSEPGFAGELLSFPARHPLVMGGILLVAAGVFATLYFLFMTTDYVTEVKRAKENMKEGKFFDAVQNLDKANEMMPDDKEILSLRGECQIEMKDWDKAITDLKAATTLDAANGKLWYLLAMAHYKKNAYEDALAAVGKAKGASYDTEELRKLALENYTQVGRPEDYVKMFGAGGADTDQPASVLVHLGTLDLLVGDLQAAGEKARAAVAKLPTEEPPHLLLTRVLETSGDAKGALAAADEGIAKVTLSPRLHYLKAQIQGRTGDFQGAINTMVEAESHGGDFRYHVEVGNVWMMQYRREPKDFFKDKAANAFKRAVEMSDGGLSSLAWGRALLAFGDTAGATAQLKLATQTIKPEELDDYGYSYLWIAHHLLKDWTGAVAVLEKSIAERRSPIASLAAKGITLYAKGDKAGAKASFDAASAAQKGRKVVAPVEYADITADDVKRMMAEVSP